jgi:uncharacterized protein
MRIPGTLNSTKQLAGVVFGALATILLLESGGLTMWATRLEIGPGRIAAVRTTSQLHKHLQPLGVEHLRQSLLISLQKIGWSDEAAPIPSTTLSPTKTQLASAPLSCNGTPKKPKLLQIPIAGLPASVPQKIALTPLPPVETGKPRVVALVGDSMMAVGLSPVLLRHSAQNNNLEMVKAFRSGTGLARPEVFDWMSEYPAMIGETNPDTIIVAIGANDGQDFMEGDKPLKFGSSEWITTYQKRAQEFLAMLTTNGSHVIWIGLPPMKAAGYNGRTVLLNRIFLSAVSENPNAVWWNPAPYIGDDTGQYREFATQADGKVERLRAADGIHMSNEGAELLSPPLMNWLNATTIAAPASAVTVPPKPSPAVTIAPGDQSSTPHN